MTDIGAGDVVVCVDDSPGRVSGRCALSSGRAYRVLDIIDGYPDGWAGFVIFPEDDLLSHCWDERRFRKIDKADEGFSTWMRSLREERQPYRVPASADTRRRAETALAGSGRSPSGAVPAKQGDAQ